MVFAASVIGFPVASSHRALGNAGAMLKPEGLLLTNDRLPEALGGLMRLGGITVVPDPAPAAKTLLAVGWYQKIAR